jgi:hypothetical protein
MEQRPEDMFPRTCNSLYELEINTSPICKKKSCLNANCSLPINAQTTEGTTSLPYIVCTTDQIK